MAPEATHTLGELRLMRDIAAGFDLWDNVATIDQRIAQVDGSVSSPKSPNLENKAEQDG